MCMPEQAGAVAAVSVTGNFIFDPATHRDFLGACLGTGVERGKVGDILLNGESGAQILVAADLVEHFERTLTQVLHCINLFPAVPDVHPVVKLCSDID